MTTPKEWYASWTLWVNIGSLVLVVLGMMLDARDILHLTEQQAFWITALVTVINGALRFKTSRPIAGTPAAKRLKT
jgi:hypothetical protein